MYFFGALTPYEEKMQENKEKPQAILLMGIPASGKSSFYRETYAGQGVTHINLDTLRTRHREQVLLQESLENRRSFVVDNTNTLPEERARYIEPARRAGYEVSGFFFRSCVSECLQRNELRENAVPKAAIAAMSKRLTLPSYDEGFDHLYFVSLADGEFCISDWI